MTPIEKLIEWLTSEALSYMKMRNGWKEHSPNWEIYDLMVRQLAKDLDKLESILPAEREEIEKAFDEGQNSVKLIGVETKMIDTASKRVVDIKEEEGIHFLKSAEQYFNETFKK